MFKIFLTLVITLALEGCASTRPVLYPNEHFNASVQRPQNVISRAAWISQSLPEPNPAGSGAGQAAAKTAGGAASGAVGGGCGGLRIGQWRDRRTTALDIQQAGTQSCL